MKTLLKKITCILMALLLCLVCFAGCGKQAAEDEEVTIYDDEEIPGQTQGGESTTVSTTSGDKTTSGSGNEDVAVGHGSAGKVNMSDALKAQLKGTTVKVLWWHDFNEADKQVVAKFEKETGMKIDMQYSANDASPYVELIAAKMAAKEGYDVAMFDYKVFPDRPLKMMQPLEKIPNYKASDWDPDVLNMYKMNGKTYGVNINASNNTEYVVMYYNKSMFDNKKVKTPRAYYEEGNWNWDTFMDCAKAMTFKNSDGSMTYGYVNLSAEAVSYWTLAGGTDFISYDSAKSNFACNIGNATLEKSLSFYLNIAKKGYMDKLMPYGPDAFKSGKAAMFSCITYQMYNDSSSRFDEMPDEIDAVPFPLPKGSKQFTMAYASAFGILQGAKNPQGGLEFIKYFLNPANYNKADKFINNNLKKTFLDVSKLPKKVPYTVGVLSGAALVDVSPTMQLICKSDVNQVKKTLDSYKSKFQMSVEKMNKKVKQAK